MKALLLIVCVLVVAVATGQSKSSDPKIAEAVKNYSKFGDTHDVSGLNQILHDQHRLVWNDGTKAPFIADKSSYIAKIESKEWGGDKRTVSIESVESFDGVNASVKAVLDGEKAQMRSIFSLVKADGEWRIIEELVNASFK